MMPKFLRPEVLPYASVTIVHVDDSVTFHDFLAHPSTGPKLDAALAEAARLDAEQLEADQAAHERALALEAEDCGSTCGPNCGFCGRCS